MDTNLEIPDGIKGNEELMLAFAASNTPPATPSASTPEPIPGVEPVIQPGTPNPAEPKHDEPVAPSVFDEAKYLASLGFSSKDEILSLKEAKEKPVATIEDPVMYALSRIKKEKPEDFNFYMKMKLTENLDNLELLAADYIRKNPSKKDKPELVRDYLGSVYGLDEEIPEPLTPDDASPEEIAIRNKEIEKAKKRIAFGEMRMEEEAAKAKQSFETEFSSFLDVKAGPTQEQLVEMTKPWVPVAKTFMESVKTVPILIPGPDGNPVKFMEYAIPQEQVQNYTSAIVDFAVGNKLPLEEGSVPKIYEHVLTQVYLSNMIGINKAIAEKARTLTQQEYDEAYRNPSALKDQVPPGSKTVSKYEESRAKALAAEGV